MAHLLLKNISKDYGKVRAVTGVDLTFRDGELTALLGPSGCGKTTLLRMVAGLEAPSTGRLTLGERDLTTVPAHARKFGMVFQNFALFPHLNVRENVCYALTISGVPKAQAYAKAAELLDLVQLSDYGDRRIGALSGGQRQRVAIARALAQEPDVFLLDEPMSALDANLRERMQVELRLLQQRLGITTIVVTHDQREAMTMSDQIVVMSEGQVEQVGPPTEIYNKPANPFVADFIGTANFFHGKVAGGKVAAEGQTLSVEPLAQFRDGSPVVIAIRPERVALTGGPVAENTLKSKVTFVRDVGATRDVHLDTALGPMIASGPADTSDTLMKVGAEIGLHLPPAAMHVFPDPAP